MISRALLCVLLSAPTASAQHLFSQESHFWDDLALGFDVNTGFGSAIDLSGDRLIVGAPNGDEAVYLYLRSGADWIQEAVLPGPSNEPFGGRVAIEGDTAFVRSGQGTSSIVRVFERTGATWNEAPPIQPSFTIWDFGTDFDVSGDTLIVGAPTDFAGFTPGTAFVFVRNGASWMREAILNASDGLDGYGFGNRVAIDGDTAVVGSSAFGTGKRGKAYIFQRTGTTWIEEQDLSPIGTLAGDRFGSDVDIDGDTVAVSALCRGSAFAFRKVGSVWTQEAELFAGDTAAAPAPFPFFTCVSRLDPISLSGDRILAGSMLDNLIGGGEGSAFLFMRGADGWRQEARLFAADGSSGDRFGSSLHLEGSTAYVGANSWEDAGLPTGYGSVYEFSLAPSPHPAFCPGTGGDGGNCTPCPCGNDSPVTLRGGCRNSQDWTCTLHVSGTASVTASSLRFDVSGASSNTFGLLMSADNRLPNVGPCAPGSGIQSPLLDGLRCVGGNLLRHGVRATNANGLNLAPWDASDLAEDSFVAGQARHFQSFYRDTQECGSGQNTSNGVSVTFLP